MLEIVSSKNVGSVILHTLTVFSGYVKESSSAAWGISCQHMLFWWFAFLLNVNVA
jgi:hypothetical protein